MHLLRATGGERFETTDEMQDRAGRAPAGGLPAVAAGAHAGVPLVTRTEAAAPG